MPREFEVGDRVRTVTRCRCGGESEGTVLHLWKSTETDPPVAWLFLQDVTRGGTCDRRESECTLIKEPSNVNSRYV